MTATLAPALSGGVSGAAALEPMVRTVLEALAEGAVRRGGPIPAGTPQELFARVARALTEPSGLRAGGAVAEPDGGDDALRRLTTLVAAGSADPADPACAAHLHCPPLAVAVAADLAISALNPSQDSWDQAPATTALETLLLGELAELVGYPSTAAGVLTSGGTESNLMGLMLARDRVLGRASGRRIERSGLPAGPPQARIFASAAAHLSVRRAAALLGLGEDAVVTIPVDHELRMRPEALAQALQECVRQGELPMAVVATAGTTDTGAIDPLDACATLAAEHGAWTHVDASYGGGALLSDRLAPLLAGLERADSVSLDWHKLGWQPAAAGSSWYGRPRRTRRWPGAPPTSTRPTTRTPATPACWGSPCAPPAAPTPSRSPSRSPPWAGTAWATSWTPATTWPAPGPRRCVPTLGWSCTPTPC